MSSNYKKESKGNPMSPRKKEFLTNKEKAEILANTEDWQVVGKCIKLPPLDPEERRRLIRSKGRYR